MKEKKIYIVTSGSYSDYRIERVFSTKEKAEEFLDGVDDNYELEEYDIDKDVPAHVKKIWTIRMNFLDKKNVCCYLSASPLLVDTFRFYENNRDGYAGILEFIIETDSKSRAIKIASERWGFIKAEELIKYPYLRVGIMVKKLYPRYDFNDGSIIVKSVDDFDDDFVNYNVETYDEDKFSDYLPRGLKYKIVKY